MEVVGSGLIINQVMQVKEGNQRPGVSGGATNTTGTNSFGNILNAALDKTSAADPVLKKVPSQPVSLIERNAIRDILSGQGNIT